MLTDTVDQTLDYLVCWKARLNISENSLTFITFLFPLLHPWRVSPHVCYTFYFESLSNLLHFTGEVWKALLSRRGRCILSRYKMEASYLYRSVTRYTWAQKHHSGIIVHRSLLMCKPIPLAPLWPWVLGGAVLHLLNSTPFPWCLTLSCYVWAVSV